MTLIITAIVIWSQWMKTRWMQGSHSQMISPIFIDMAVMITSLGMQVDNMMVMIVVHVVQLHSLTKLIQSLQGIGMASMGALQVVIHTLICLKVKTL